MNERITKKERGLLKGAIRRVFSRSELRQKVLSASEINHSDPSRPRVKKWVMCKVCVSPTPKYKAAIDHIDPVVPITVAFEDMSIDTVIDRLWCEEKGLQTICQPCHIKKSLAENKARREHKKRSKANGK